VIFPDSASLAAARAQVAYQAGHGSVQVLNADECVQREPTLAPSKSRIAGGYG
jgi:hypothetical protein